MPEATRRGWRRHVLRRAIAAVVALGVYGLVMFPLGCGRSLANRVLLFPSTGPVPAGGGVAASVPTPVGEVEVIVARSASAVGVRPDRYVLRLMGNGSRAEFEASDIARRWGEEPTEVWALNYPGYGGSEGPAALEKLLPAASAVWDRLNDHAGDAPVYLDGDSMGSAVSLALAARRRGDRPPAGIVLKNPPPLRELIVERYGWWNLWLLAGPVASAVPADLDAIANAGQVHARAIFLTATADGLIPPAFQRRVIDAFAGRGVVLELEGADHNTPLTGEEEGLLREMIREQFPMPSAVD